MRPIRHSDVLIANTDASYAMPRRLHLTHRALGANDDAYHANMSHARACYAMLYTAMICIMLRMPRMPRTIAALFHSFETCAYGLNQSFIC